jgi:YbbR domain-containing protein
MDFFRRIVLHNAGLKILSLVIAVLLWMAVSREPRAEVTLTVPIEFHNAPAKLEINSENIQQVQVLVRGPVGAVHSVSDADVHAFVNLEAASPGEHTYDLHVRVPRDVDVVQVIPSQFRISFDDRATKRVDVRPRVIGATAPGFRMEQVTVDPSSVMITGPEKRVDAIDAVITDPVDASGVMGKATFNTHIYVSDPLVRLIGPSTADVTVVTDTKGRQGEK